MNASDGSFSIGSDVWPGVSKLIEEAGEVIQVAGKLIATHGQEDHWDGTNLRARLVEEMGDVAAAIAFVANHLDEADRDALIERTGQKLALFDEWQEAQS